MKRTYELHQHAGKINYAAWKESGIVIPVFDKDGTLTDANQNTLVEEVIVDMEKQGFPDIFPDVAAASNNHDAEHVEEFAELLNRRLGVGVFAVCRAQGFPSKPNPEMGFAIAKHFDVKPEQLGIIGDRRLTDVRFGRAIGAGAISLCAKVGIGDAKWVPTLRVVEQIIVGAERMANVALQY